MNDLSKSNGLNSGRCSCEPIPAPVICILIALFSIGLAVSIFILVVVHNASFLLIHLLLSTLVFAFLLWNACTWKKKKKALLAFLDTFPDSDLHTAKHGQLVKITGFASCGSLSLESSYEKVPRCVYTSSLLYEYGGFGLNPSNVDLECFQWSLAYSERFTTDFYITDTKFGMRAMVKAGYDSNVIPLIDESTLVSTTRKNRLLSSYLRKWLGERNLSADARLLRLEEGYIKEGSSVTVMGVLTRSNGVAMIVQPPEPISTGCLWRTFFLPVDVDGLIISLSGKISSMATLSSP